MGCEDAKDPEPMDTPDPLVNSMEHGIVVNFIVGEDGRVYSPIVLEEDDSSQTTAQTVKTINHWRYRPAMCDGVPVATEVAVQFTDNR